MATITEMVVRDVRFPTHKTIGDAMNRSPDYSCAYVVLKTDQDLEGHGLTFTIGRGTEVVCAACRALEHLVVGRTLKSCTDSMGKFYRHLVTGDTQLRWIGPQKGAVHLATGAVINAVWDMWAKQEGKPLWRLVCDLTPEQLVQTVDFYGLTDAITPEEALEIFKRAEPTKHERVAFLEENGYPCYITSAGWIGLSDDVVRARVQDAVDNFGLTHIKMKVGINIDDDERRLEIVRSIIGPERTLMTDANQVWEVDQAIDWMERLARFRPLWIEEPVSPDDIAGHKKVRDALKPHNIGVATGEMCQNAIMFKQFIQQDAIDFVQIDSTRLAGVGESLAVMLMAAKYGKPICPHAGGVGLCEYVQHLSMIDYVVVCGSMEGRIVEFVDELHNHFEDPPVVRGGCYRVPTAPGYSITMKPASIEAHEFPDGAVWVEELPKRREEEAAAAAAVAAAAAGGNAGV